MSVDREMAGTGKLRIMPEYECYSFWVFDGTIHENTDPAETGISEDLASAIEAWEEEYEDTYVPDDPASSGFESDEAKAEFNETGRALARRVAAELGSGWEVDYFDVVAQKDERVSAG